MINKIMKEIESINNKRINDIGEIWSIERPYHNLEYFLNDILEYFNLDKIIKDDYNFDYMRDYKKQKHKYLSYIPYLLHEIKPYLLLAFKLSQNTDITKKLKNNEITEDSIVNMINNFININRTGRKRKISRYHLEKFKEFKEKYQNLVAYSNEIDSFDGVKTGSMLDHAHAIKKHNLSKESLWKFIEEWKHFYEIIKDCSRATLYRYDKDFILFKNIYYDIESASKNFDFYMKTVLQEK